MFRGHPQSYLENPAHDVISAISPVSDETLVLPGSEPGKGVAEARRYGNQCSVAVINGGEAPTLDISLNILGSGPWKSTQLHDAKDKPDAWDRQDDEATRTLVRVERRSHGGPKRSKVAFEETAAN
jgi:alpha-glucosidase